MPVVTYTTSIAPEKTISEITKRLVDAGAYRISTDYDGPNPVGLTFMLKHPEHGQPLAYSLPVNAEAMRQVLVKQLGPRQKSATSIEQATRVAWRVMKHWIEAQLALVETRMVGLDDIMLPFMHVDDSGVRLLDQYHDRMLESRKD